MSLAHPSHDALVAFLKGELRGDRAAEIESHLGACDECVEALHRLSGHQELEDRLKGLVRQPRANDRADEQRLVEDLKARGPAKQTTDGLEQALPSSETWDQATEAFPAAEQAVRLKCPHCGHGIQLVAPAVGEIICESCGSSFRLEPGAALAAPAGELPKVIGKFEILEQLGRGAFGAVYKARDRDLDRIVAVKVPRAGTFDTPEAEERFVREARSAAHLRHHNIVQVHEIAYERGVPYIVSEYIDGKTLAEVVTAGRPGFRETAELVAEIAEALDYAHRQEIIHRDIKPSNILVQRVESGESRVKSQQDSSGSRRSPLDPSRTSALDSPPSALRPYLTDFGLARRDEGEITMTVEGQILGTPAYMSPEQAAGDQRSVDGRSDVYSLGVVLYELLTGERPFSGNKRMLLQQVMSDEPRPPRRLNDRIPRDLETICLKAMAKSPTRRYDTARELADDLRRWLKNEPIHARPVGRWERTTRWCKRNPLVATLVTAIGLLLVALTIGGITIAIRERLTANRERTLRSRAEEAEGSERRAKNHEAQQRQQSENRLARLYVEKGRKLMHDGDLSGSLLWFVEALGLEDGDSLRADAHRTRIASVMRQCVRPVQVWQHPADIVAAEFSPDGRYLLTASSNAVYDEVGEVGLWDAATGKELVPPWIHGKFVCSAGFSPDGRLIVTATSGVYTGEPYEARVWDATNGDPVGPPLIHDAAVDDARFSPDGSRVVTAGDDGCARVWDPKSGQLLLTLEHGVLSSMTALFSPDGTRILTASGVPADARDEGNVGSARLWASTTGNAVGQPMKHAGWIEKATFDPTGRYVATSSADATIGFWDATTGKPVCEPVRFMASDIAFSPTGDRLAAIIGDHNAQNGRTCIWSVPGGKLLLSVPHGDTTTTLAWKPDGKCFAVGSAEGIARIYDATTGQRATRALEHPARVWSVAFSPNGDRLITACGNEEEGTTGEARVWDIRSEKLAVPPLQHHRGVRQAAFSPDGRTIVTGSGGYVMRGGGARVWDARTGKLITAVQEGHGVQFAKFAPDGSRFATAHEKQVHVWDVKTGKSVGPSLDHKYPVNGVSFDADSKRLVTASGQRDVSDYEPDSVPLGQGANRGPGEVRIWQIETGQLAMAPLEYERSVAFAVVTPDGDRLVTLEIQGLARVYDAHDGRLLVDKFEHADGVGKICLSPDGQQVLTVARAKLDFFAYPGQDSAGSAIAVVWDVATGTRKINTGQHASADGLVSSLRDARFSPDGKRIVTIGGQSVCVWNADTGQPALAPIDHPSDVTHAVFSPDGRFLATVCESDYQRSQVRIWDTFTDNGVGSGELAQARMTMGFFAVPDAVRGISFAPRGPYVVVSDREFVWLLDVQGAPLVSMGAHPCDDAFFSRDGRLVVTATAEEEIRVWDLATGAQAGPVTNGFWDFASSNAPTPINLANDLRSCDLSPDGSRLMLARRIGTKSQLFVRDVSTGKETGPLIDFPYEYVRGMFSPDGAWILTLCSTHLSSSSADFRSEVRVWDAHTGQSVSPVLQDRPTAWPEQACFTSDGRHVITATQFDRALSGPSISESPPSEDHPTSHAAVRLWDVRTGTAIATWANPNESRFSMLKLSRDGSTCVVTNNTAFLYYETLTYNANTGHLTARWNMDTRWWDTLFDFRLSQDGRVLIHGSGGYVYSYDTRTGQRLAERITLPKNSRITAVSRDGKRIAIETDESTLRVCDWTRGQFVGPVMVHKHPGFDRRTEFSPDGRWLASEDGEGVMVWAVESGDPVMPPLFVGGYGPSLEFSPDGRTLLLPGFLQTRLWDLRPEERSVEDIRVVSQLLAARRLDNGKAIGPSDPGSMPDLLARVRSSEKNQRRHDISFYPSIETALLWHQQQAAICHRITYFTAALYHLNVLVEAFGSRPDYRMQRGDVHAFLDQFDRAVADYTRASELKTDDRRVWFNRGYCFAQQSKWKDAEADFSRAVTTQTEEVRAAYFHALTLLAMDQIDAYQIACTKAQTKYGADLPSDIAWMCLLHPEGNPDLASLVKLLQERLDKRSSQLLQLCLGAAYYRHGEFAEAVKRLRQSIEVQKRDETTEPTVYSESLGEDKLADAWLFLVMAHKRLGQDQDAQQWLGKAAPVVARLCPENAQDLARNESQAFLPWNQRLELRLLYAEAKSLIENKSASSSTSNDKQE